MAKDCFYKKTEKFNSRFNTKPNNQEVNMLVNGEPSIRSMFFPHIPLLNSTYSLLLLLFFKVHEGYVLKLTKKLQFQEKTESNRRRVLTDSETVRWLNHAIEKMWSVCMEEIVSQKILLPMVPWFLQKYKPWTAKDVEIQHLYLGRSPPIFTDMRVLQNSNGDDHLVMELGMNFRTADDMSAILGVKLRKRLGFGMWAKLHLVGMHVEGKVLVGVKFLRKWPFIGRLRVCFSGPPYFQMTVKPIFNHGLDVTELPGIAGWIDNLLAVVFEQTLVEPNMLVVDVEKFAQPESSENWFSVNAKDPIAHAIVEVLEAAEMKPSDMNGLADPYVKGRLGPYKFRTKTQKKILTPKWHEEFKIPICTWESQNILVIEVRDKDHLYDDLLGDCSININELRDGQRHDMWLPLQNIKMGRLRLAVTVSEANGKVSEPSCVAEVRESDLKDISFAADSTKKGSFSSLSSGKSPKVADKFEPIDIEGQSETGIWIHHPGSEVSQVWEPRKGKSRHNSDGGDLLDSFKSSSGQNDGSSSDESTDAKKSQSSNPVKRGFKKIGSVFKRSPRTEDKSISPGETEPSPDDNIAVVNTKEGGVKLVIDDNSAAPSPKNPKDDEKECREENGPESQQHMKDMAKSIYKQAGKSARGLRSALSRSRKSKNDKNALSEVDSSDDESLSSLDATPADLVIPGSAVSSPASISGNNSFKSKDSVVQIAGNSSFKSKDNVVQTSNPAGNSSFKSSENTVESGAYSVNNNVKSEDSSMEQTNKYLPEISTTMT
ncbi:hypothetical protein BUALT_Bualt03G0174100 [Buddleja alternifolia]|uniref:C2 domain-containing protein n=1 Tax=Buddleja alternifolia TaxID=168488 RepID=A0AAV6XVT1_9LAMI|nr:hypothetical protein BUALT_Bualt03G0174100 [Buddleja alternifolia]